MEINDDILISYLLNEADKEQVHGVQEWLKTPSNQHHFNKYKLIWEATASAGTYEPGDAAASLQILKQKAANRNAKIITLPLANWIKIAAAIIVIVGAAWLVITQRKIPQLQWATAGSVKTDTLSDGSVVTLNRNSLLQFPEKFTGGQRNVKLTNGEAFFNVAHDKTNPFIITSGDITIKVVGTSFNVKNKNGDVEVIVETGLVRISRNGEAIALTPGEKVWISKNTLHIAKEKNPDHLYTYYRSREFVADNVPLWRMVQVLNEAYESNIVIGRKELRDLPLNTTFKNESLDDILQVISRTFKLSVERKNNQVIIK